MFKRIINNREFIFIDTQYYKQPNRKLAIIHNNFKYIYNKATKMEELYDLSYDPFENCNLIYEYQFDSDRQAITPLKELYFYPKWDNIDRERKVLREKKDSIWRTESGREAIETTIKVKCKKIEQSLKHKLIFHT